MEHKCIAKLQVEKNGCGIVGLDTSTSKILTICRNKAWCYGYLQFKLQSSYVKSVSNPNNTETTSVKTHKARLITSLRSCTLMYVSNSIWTQLEVKSILLHIYWWQVENLFDKEEKWSIISGQRIQVLGGKTKVGTRSRL
jgi:hypothetical protein